MISIIIGAALSVIWYALVIYVIPYVRFEQIFCDRGLINYIITFIGFYGISLSGLVFVKNTNNGKEIDNIFVNLNEVTPPLDQIEVSKKIYNDKILCSYSNVSFVSGLCVTFGFLGTVVGIGGGVGNLSSVFVEAGDLTKVRDGIFGLVSNLGVAFDSTLLGLVFSIIISIILSVCKQYDTNVINKAFNSIIKKSIDNGKGIFNKEAQINFPTIDNSILELYVKQMNDFQDKITLQLTIYNKVIEKFSSANEITEIKNIISKSSDILEKILLITKINSNRKLFKLIEVRQELPEKDEI